MAGVVRLRPGPEADFEPRKDVKNRGTWRDPSNIQNLKDDYYMSGSDKSYTEGNLKVLFTVECAQEVMCCKFNEASTMLAAGCADGSVKVFSADNGAGLYNLTDEETKRSALPCTSINFRIHHEDDKSLNILLATYASGMVKLWHLSTQQCLHTIHETRQTLTSAFQTDASHFATAGADDKIYVYDTATKKLVQTCQPSMSKNVMDGHRCRVFALKFHPKKMAEFISGGWDDTVQYWDIRQEHSHRSFFGPHITGNDALDLDPQHNHIVTGSWRRENSLQIWDYDKASFIKSVPDDMNSTLPYCAQWIGQSIIAVGGSEAHLVRIIDRGTLRTIGRLVDLPGGVYSMDHSLKGRAPKLAVASARKVYFLEITET